MGYKIGSFNLKNIGKKATDEDNKKDLQKIAEIIKKEQFDVIALQEVLSEGAAFVSQNIAEKTILKELGSNYDFKWANTAGESSNDLRNEGYAFLWNKRKLQLSTIRYFDGTEKTYNPRVYRVRNNSIFRRPYYARFTPVGTMLSGPYMELRFICIHTYYGNDNNESRKIRQEEIHTIMHDIYPQISDRVYKGDMPHYTILLGDYNLELYREWKYEMRLKENVERRIQGKSRLITPAYLHADENDCVEVADWDHKRIKTVQDEFTTLRGKNKEGVIERDYKGEGYACDYDHFSYELSQFSGIRIKSERINAVNKYCNGNYEEYLDTVSDHVPIMMEIELK